MPDRQRKAVSRSRSGNSRCLAASWLRAGGDRAQPPRLRGRCPVGLCWHSRHGFAALRDSHPERGRILMPMFFYEAPSFTLRGLFHPEFDVLDRLPFYTPALIGLAVALAAGLVLARARNRGLSPGISGGNMSREEALSHLRRVKAELKGRQGETAVAAVLARAGFPALHDVIVRDARGLTQVDHLVRLADGIAVLEAKAHGGTVTGHVWARRWVQEFRGGRVRTAFPNPVRQNHRHVLAVRCGAWRGGCRCAGAWAGGVVGWGTVLRRTGGRGGWTGRIAGVLGGR